MSRLNMRQVRDPIGFLAHQHFLLKVQGKQCTGLWSLRTSMPEHVPTLARGGTFGGRPVQGSQAVLVADVDRGDSSRQHKQLRHQRLHLALQQSCRLKVLSDHAIVAWLPLRTPPKSRAVGAGVSAALLPKAIETPLTGAKMAPPGGKCYVLALFRRGILLDCLPGQPGVRQTCLCRRRWPCCPGPWQRTPHAPHMPPRQLLTILPCPASARQSQDTL